MKIRYLDDLANVKAGDVVEQPRSTAEWLIERGAAERVEETPIALTEEPEPTPEVEPMTVEPTPEPAPVKRGPGRPRKNP